MNPNQPAIPRGETRKTKTSPIIKPNSWDAVWEGGRIVALVRGNTAKRYRAEGKVLREWGKRWQAEAKEESK